MSVHGICFYNGHSWNCTPSCEQFLKGKCECPDNVIDGHIDDDYGWAEIFNLYPNLQNSITKENAMSNNSKVKNILNTQQKDRIEAAGKLLSMISRLTKGTKPDVFFDDTACRDIFEEGIHVPVKIRCIQSGGERKVFINSFEVSESTLSIIMSKELIGCLSSLKKAAEEIDTDMGCEHLSNEIDKHI